MTVSGVDILTEIVAQGMACNPAALATWRNLVIKDLSFFSSPISEKIRNEGRIQGRAEDVLRLLERRGLHVSEEDRERVTSCDDLDVLGRWFDQAVTAASTTEVWKNEQP